MRLLSYIPLKIVAKNGANVAKNGTPTLFYVTEVRNFWRTIFFAQMTLISRGCIASTHRSVKTHKQQTIAREKFRLSAFFSS